MAITMDSASIEARYAGKTSGSPPPETEIPFYYPGSNQPPPAQDKSQIPKGDPIPEGVIISQVVGRGQPAPSMAVVPPKIHQPGAPQIAVVPPTGSSRTTIGTFVEPTISPTVSNPLTMSPQAPPSGITEPPKEVEKPKRPELDLPKEILTHVWELGGEKSEECQKFYERGEQTLKNWQKNPGTIPLECVLKFLKRAPGVREMIADQLEPHFAANGKENWTQSLPTRGKTSVVVCAPIMGQPTLPFMWTLLYLAKKYELGFDVQADTAVWRSRNMLAHRFLKTGANWSLWLDSDIAGPIANPDWYRWITRSEVLPEETAKFDLLQRLQSHSKPIVGGVYAMRTFHGQLVIQPDIKPRNHQDKQLANEIRRASARGLAAVDWIGFGCALVHREVFLEVQRRFPDLAPQSEFAPWRLFQPVGDEGEDEAFCQRVQACSIPIWLDTQLVCPHMGNMAFLPEHTAHVMAL
jgi:hypothetical protein